MGHVFLGIFKLSNFWIFFGVAIRKIQTITKDQQICSFSCDVELRMSALSALEKFHDCWKSPTQVHEKKGEKDGKSRIHGLPWSLLWNIRLSAAFFSHQLRPISPSSWWGEYLGSWPCCIEKFIQLYSAVQRRGLQRNSHLILRASSPIDNHHLVTISIYQRV